MNTKSVHLGESMRLRLLSYNIQVGIASSRLHHYVTNSWKHVLPHAQLYDNLDQIAGLIRDFDIVGLQEVDAGSLRTGFINQTKYLADSANFPYWYHQMNRKIGKIAAHSNGVLSKFSPLDVSEHKLPGLVPGRGAMMLRYGAGADPLVIVLLHLALSKRARLQQLDYVSDIIRDYNHVIVMGDMNCQPQSEELRILLDRTNLREPVDGHHTFPSWRPSRTIDHILVSSTLEIRDMKVLPFPFSDHLPIAVDIAVPRTVGLGTMAA